MTLIERIEAAPGPDRRLDAEIANYIWRGTVEGTQSLIIPAYTASINAAMMLVPEGWEWSLYSAQSGFRPEAQLETEAMRQRESFEPVSSSGATPALALLSACLKAMGVDRG